jgi:hypothetical protein
MENERNVLRPFLENLGAAIALAAILASGPGCYKQVFVNDGTVRENSPSDTFWQKNLLWGLVAGPDIDLDSYCYTEFAEIQESFEVGNFFVTALTLGIYYPYTVVIYCSKAETPKAPSPLEEDGTPAKEKVIDMGGLKPIPVLSPLSPPVQKGRPSP